MTAADARVLVGSNSFSSVKDGTAVIDSDKFVLIIFTHIFIHIL